MSRLTVKRFLAERIKKKKEKLTKNNNPKRAFDKWAAVLAEREAMFWFDSKERNVKPLPPNNLYYALFVQQLHEEHKNIQYMKNRTESPVECCTLRM